MAKSKKKDKKKDEPLKVYGSFEDVIKVSVTPKKDEKKEEDKASQKKS